MHLPKEIFADYAFFRNSHTPLAHLFYVFRAEMPLEYALFRICKRRRGVNFYEVSVFGCIVKGYFCTEYIKSVRQRRVKVSLKMLDRNAAFTFKRRFLLILHKNRKIVRVEGALKFWIFYGKLKIIVGN